MYIKGAQTHSQVRSPETMPDASTALGESKTLSAEDLRKAVIWNRRYAYPVGWRHYTRQIANLLSITAANPDIWSFVQALAQWQARNGMMPNGILGPGEWYTMQTPNRRP